MTKKTMQKKKGRTAVIVLSFLLTWFFLSSAYYVWVSQRISQEKTQYGYIAVNTSERIMTTIDCIMARTGTLKALVQDHQGRTDFFDHVAASVYDAVLQETGVALKNLAIAPRGVVSNVYPYEGNEALLGFDFMDLNKKGNAEARDAYIGGATILTNPFPLIQGGEGMAGRTPVLLMTDDRSELWGLVTVTIDYDRLIETLHFEHLENMGIDYVLSYIDEDGAAHVMKGVGTLGDDAVIKRFAVRNLTWELALRPKDGWSSTGQYVIWECLFLLMSCFVAKFVDMVFRLRDTNVALKKDIDKEKKVQDELQDLSKRALAASKAKSSFLSNMSHEIRTPINAVLGMNEMILRECQEDSILAYAASIKTAGDTLLGIINDILDFSKIEAGKLEILPVAYDLSSVLDDLVNMVQARADDKDIALAMDFDNNTPKRLYGDDVRIKQAITNLLTNAVKYTEKGSVTFSVGFERIESEPDSVMLCVSIKDTGIGIKPEDMEKLFTEFSRIEEKRNRHVEGTGLGMAITRNLLDMMGSTLQVESSYGLGSKFSFRLKQKVIKWEPLGDYETSSRMRMEDRKSYHEKFTAPGAMVLVVDDNSMNLMVFKSLLKQTLVVIDTANDADEGLRRVAEKKYDILFLDHMMPGKDGIEMLQELRAQVDGPNRETPAVCLTANAVSGAREQYLSAGFDDYLTKPITPWKLEDMLLSYLPAEKLEAPVEKDAAPDIPDIPDVLASLKDQDWIDIFLGIKNSGSVDDYLLLLKIFYESLDEKMDELDGFYHDGRLKDYTIRVHAIKSSARIIGAKDFGEEAQKLENAASSGDMAYLREHHEVFAATCRGFKVPLSEVFRSDGACMEKPEADEGRMKSVYEGLRSAAEDMDCDRLENIFAEMEAYCISAQEASLWEQLKKASEQYDYENILSLLPQGDGEGDK